MIIDTHLHLDSPEFKGEEDNILSRGKEAGVFQFINAATNIESSRTGISLVSSYSTVYTAVGVHPHEAFEVDENILKELKDISCNPKVIAIGETGLDYHYQFALPEIQRSAFRHQIQLARELSLPLIIHCRDAFGDLIKILVEEKGREAGGVIHCFTGNWDEAERLINMGFYIGITGIITFNNAAPLAKVVKRVPMERLLVETDAPYLAPFPHRGKRNEPSLLIHIVEKVAKLKEVSLSEISQTTTQNAATLFKLTHPQ